MANPFLRKKILKKDLWWIILFVLLAIGMFIHGFISDSKFFKEVVYHVHFSGIVRYKCRLDYKKPTFFLVDTTWIGITNYDKYIEPQDSVLKKDSSYYLHVLKKDSLNSWGKYKKFHRPRVHIVKKDRIIRELNKQFNKDGNQKNTH